MNTFASVEIHANTEANSSQNTQAVLQLLLDANASFALDAKGTTNHCPMALIALAEMGADANRLQAFFKHWQEHYAIEEGPSLLSLHVDNWQSALGKHEYFGPLRQYLLTWLAQKGQTEVLSAVLSQIPFTPAAGAFHAVIRLAYGLQAKHQGEIAAGLAALCVGYFPLPSASMPRAGQAVSAQQGLAILASEVGAMSFTERWITSKMKIVAANPHYQAALPQVTLQQTDLAQLAQLAIAAYWQTRDFTILHLVTGLHALRIVFAHLPSELIANLMPKLWPSIAAAYVTVGAPSLLKFEQAQSQAEEYLQQAKQDLSWPSLLKRACASDNDHLIKLSYSCYAEQQNLQKQATPLYQAVVARLLGA